jgi:catechol 2,3-dioxygenase-like lactoylglutathione lyase family enzyme
MLSAHPIMAFVATADAGRARAFYEGKLGLTLVSDDPYALVFDAAGTMLRVQKVEKVAPIGYTVLGWRVTDIATVVSDLARKGVALERYGFPGQDDRGVWSSPSGAKVAWFKDPDGNTLSLTEG